MRWAEDVIIIITQIRDLSYSIERAACTPSFVELLLSFGAAWWKYGRNRTGG